MKGYELINTFVIYQYTRLITHKVIATINIIELRNK